MTGPSQGDGLEVLGVTRIRNVGIDGSDHQCGFVGRAEADKFTFCIHDGEHAFRDGAEFLVDPDIEISEVAEFPEVQPTTSWANHCSQYPIISA